MGVNIQPYEIIIIATKSAKKVTTKQIMRMRKYNTLIIVTVTFKHVGYLDIVHSWQVWHMGE